jgi:glycyl-tRNA synthetase
MWRASQIRLPGVTGCPECGRHYRADHLAEAIWNSKWFDSLKRRLASENDAAVALQKWAAGDGKKLAPNLALVQRPEVILSLWKSKRPGYRFVRAEFGELLDGIACAPDGTPHNPCPNCGGQMSEPRPASLMLETFLGPVKETATKTYLRPETAQGMFVNFDNVP